MRRMTLTGDQHLVKRINRMALVRLLREEPGLSRADLSTHSGLTKSTISILAKELIDAQGKVSHIYSNYIIDVV
jgi:DNA-binding MarR family transcriptional regulator